MDVLDSMACVVLMDGKQESASRVSLLSIKSTHAYHMPSSLFWGFNSLISMKH